MKTMPKLFAIAFFLFFASQASAWLFDGIQIIPQAQNLSMGANDTVGILYTFTNTSSSRQCIEIFIGSNSPYVSASFPQNSLCLNAGESTQMALSIHTTDAKPANYALGMLLKTQGNSVSIAIANITVGSAEGNLAVEIIPYPTDACRGKEEFINVLVRNNTPFFQIVQLNAESEILLPNFEQKEIFLDSFSEKNVKLFVHTNSSTSPASREVSIYATTQNGDYTKKTAQVFVKDCDGITAPGFQVSFDSSCTAIEKTKSAKFYFSVKNLLSKSQIVNIAVLSDLPNYLGNSSIVLDAFEERTLVFDINARLSDANTDHNASLIVWNENNRIEKSKCISVKAASIAEIELLNNNLLIMQGKAEVFVFLAKNIGDLSKKFDFSIPNVPSNITVSFSDNNFTLGSNTEKEVFLYISVSENANIGNYDLNVIVKAESQTIKRKASFKIIEKAADAVGEGLAIESYPLQVQAKENSETSVSIKLRNNTKDLMGNIQVSLKNLPEAIHASTAKGIELNPSEARAIALNLTIGKIPAGTYKAVIEAKNSSGIQTREIEIVISTAEQAPAEQPLPITGFFTMGQGIAFGLVLLIIILLLAIAIIGLFVSKHEKTLLIERMGALK